MSCEHQEYGVCETCWHNEQMKDFQKDMFSGKEWVSIPDRLHGIKDEEYWDNNKLYDCTYDEAISELEKRKQTLKNTKKNLAEMGFSDFKYEIGAENCHIWVYGKR